MALLVDIKKKLGNFSLDVHFKAEDEVPWPSWRVGMR